MQMENEVFRLIKTQLQPKEVVGEGTTTVVGLVIHCELKNTNMFFVTSSMKPSQF